MPRSALFPRALHALRCLLAASAFAVLGASPGLAQAATWSDALRLEVERIDKQTPGTLGVYVKRLDNGEVLDYHASEPWYLASTAKVAVAITVLQQVDAGKLRLDQKVTLQDTDKVDGSGQLVWTPAGTQHTIDSLLTRMLGVSDNTAANLLIRTVGIEQLNKTASEVMGKGEGKGFGRLSNFTQVRYDVYAQFHPDARKLTNLQLVQIAGAPQGAQRVEALRRALDVPASELKVKTMNEAYANYYQDKVNTAPLVAYGDMLEKLVQGKLLKPASTQRLFNGMKYGTPGSYRLEAGFPKNVRRIHKTGTQYRRACHMAVINPQDNGAKAIVITTCAADLDDVKEAGGVFERVGRAVTETMLPAK